MVLLQNLHFKTAKIFTIKNICINQVSKCGFRSIWAYFQNRHAISYYIKIYNSQYIEIVCIYSKYLNIQFFPFPDNLEPSLTFIRATQQNSYRFSEEIPHDMFSLRSIQSQPERTATSAVYLLLGALHTC